MDPERMRRELALQIEGELCRGITFWADEEWNTAARRFLRGRAPATLAAELRAPVTPAPRGTVATQARQRAPRPQFGPPPPAEGRDPDWEAQLAALAEEVKQCVKCRLHETRQNVVVSSGSGRVPLVFASEAPGADEDAQGEAFVGRAGQLLTKIIAAIGLDRKDVYICNVLKCRPPENRNPMADEIELCTPYLRRQLAILKPRLICTLGLFATQVLLESKAPIGKLRGRVFRYEGIPLVPTYHPAALLRNPALKRTVWEDMLLVRKILDEGLAAPALPVEETPGRSTKRGAESGDLFGGR